MRRPGASWMLTSVLLGFILLGFILLGGCDLGVEVQQAPAECTEAGAQCRLGKGPLGVCERSRCSAFETPPCYQCTPQH